MWNAALRPLFTMVSCLCRVMVVCERAGSCSPLGVQVAFVFVIVCVDETQIPDPYRDGPTARLRLRLYQSDPRLVTRAVFRAIV